MLCDESVQHKHFKSLLELGVRLPKQHFATLKFAWKSDLWELQFDIVEGQNLFSDVGTHHNLLLNAFATVVKHLAQQLTERSPNCSSELLISVLRENFKCQQQYVLCLSEILTALVVLGKPDQV